MAASLIEWALMGEKMRAAAVGVFLSLKLVLRGQASRTRHSKHCCDGYADSSSASPSASSQASGQGTVKGSNKRKHRFPQITNPQSLKHDPQPNNCLPILESSQNSIHQKKEAHN